MDRRHADALVRNYGHGKGWTWRDDSGVTWALDPDREIYVMGQTNVVRLGQVARIDVRDQEILIAVDRGVVLRYELH